MMFHLVNSQNVVISSTLVNTCKVCYQRHNNLCELIDDCQDPTKKRRIGKIVTSKGITFLCTDKIKKTSFFKKEIEIMNHSLSTFEAIKDGIKRQISQEEKTLTRRLLHNLSSLVAHCNQEIDNLVSQDKLVAKLEEQIQLFIDSIKTDPLKAAKAFSKILRNNNAMIIEFSVFNKLSNETKINLDFRKHSIVKVIMNVVQPFFQEFRDKSIYVYIQQDETKIIFDYETIRVALYHIFDNALKYTKPSSELRIKFSTEKDKFIIYFSMLSLKIEIDELDKIFEEGYFGKNTSGKSGSGIGMFLTKKLLKLNNADINVIAGQSGNMFAHNIFEVHFPLSSIE